MTFQVGNLALAKRSWFVQRRMLVYAFEVKVRLGGRVSYIQVTARDAAHARSLVRAQYGDAITILQTKRL